MLISIISTLLAAATVTVYNPRVPVIVDREFNVVSEIVIPSESAAQVTGEVEVSLEGIPLKAIKDVTNCGLREAKDAVDLQRVDCEPEQRDALTKAIEEAGGKVM